MCKFTIMIIIIDFDYYYSHKSTMLVRIHAIRPIDTRFRRIVITARQLRKERVDDVMCVSDNWADLGECTSGILIRACACIA